MYTERVQNHLWYMNIHESHQRKKVVQKNPKHAWLVFQICFCFFFFRHLPTHKWDHKRWTVTDTDHCYFHVLRSIYMLWGFGILRTLCKNDLNICKKKKKSIFSLLLILNAIMPVDVINLSSAQRNHIFNTVHLPNRKKKWEQLSLNKTFDQPLDI